jgi:hypothetical protein
MVPFLVAKVKRAKAFSINQKVIPLTKIRLLCEDGMVEK